MTSIIDKHAPITGQLMKMKHKTWYDKDALKVKIQRGKAEKTWHKMQLKSGKKHYQHVDKCYKRYVHHSKKKFLWEQLGQYNKRSKTL